MFTYLLISAWSSLASLKEGIFKPIKLSKSRYAWKLNERYIYLCYIPYFIFVYFYLYTVHYITDVLLTVSVDLLWSNVINILHYVLLLKLKNVLTVMHFEPEATKF